MRKRLIPLCAFLILLTGCCKTTTADRVYTVCAIDNETIYAYNQSGEFISVSDGNIKVHSGAGLTAKPVLKLLPTDGEYLITSTDIPCKYKATFESFSNYINVLLKQDGVLMGSCSATCYDYELYIHAADYDMRCLWDTAGYLRLYAIDKYNNPITPPYLIE